jgi:hypothetical protein|tara:strand:+ start:896 stop:1198 length:303 start_codon:yes stop_codon:yes gene_type:complete
MSDEEHSDVEEFEKVESGASTTVPMQAGSVRKGGFMVIKGRPTKVRLCGKMCGIPRREMARAMEFPSCRVRVRGSPDRTFDRASECGLDTGHKPLQKLAT